MAIEIVDLSINSMLIFQFAMLVYQRVTNMKYEYGGSFWDFMGI